MPVIILKLMLIGGAVFVVFFFFMRAERKNINSAREHPLVKLYARKFSIAKDPFIKLSALQVLLENEGESFTINILRKAVREELLLMEEKRKENQESTEEIEKEREMIEEAHKLEDFLREDSVLDELTDSVEESEISYVSGLDGLHKKRKDSLAYLQNLDESKFIVFMKKLFSEIGYKPISMQKGPEGGIYYLLEKTDGILAAYVYNGQNIADKNKIESLSKFTNDNGTNEMLAISLSDFNTDAKIKAKELSIKLWDSYKLNQLITAFKVTIDNVESHD